MSNLSVFTFQSEKSVRIELFKNEPFFCLKDVAEILELKDTKSKNFNLQAGGVETFPLIDKLGRKQEATFINEPNLYRVIFRSNKPEAVKFQNWIFEEVIPQIRKTGSYSIDFLPTLPNLSDDPEAKDKYLRLSDAYHELSKQALQAAYDEPAKPAALPAAPATVTHEPAPENDVLFYTEINNVQVATLFHDGTKYYLAKHLAEAAGLKWESQIYKSGSYFTRLRHFQRGRTACWVSEQSASLWLGRKNPRRVSCPLQLAQTVECLGLLV